jgi:hypothetical protein
MGQAAGMAAALSVESEVMPRALDGRLLVNELARQGAIVSSSW